MKKIEVIVQGAPCTVYVVDSAPLSHVIARALHEAQAHTYGRSPGEWELRTADGVLLDHALTVLDVDAAPTLFLGPPAGVGG